MAVAVVAVPFPAQGHLNQLLHFSLLLSSNYDRGVISVHYACSALHNRQARDRIEGWPPAELGRVQFHDLELPPFDNPAPDNNSSEAFPTQLQPLIDTTPLLAAPLAALLRGISASHRRVVVVNDPLMAFVTREAALLPNTESYSFQCTSAFYKLSSLLPATSVPVPSGLSPAMLSLLTTPDECFSNEFQQFCTASGYYSTPAEAGVLVNSSRALEHEFLHLLSGVHGYDNLFSIGPVAPMTIPEGESDDCIRWLDGQQPGSVIYIAFGSTAMLSDPQMAELAIGLLRSGHPFIWALKYPDRGDVYAEVEAVELLAGLEEEARGRGKVVRGWAPQLGILAHPSTAAFMSHCGWNSCMESLTMGVPVLAWPMHSDQPRNALMLTGYLNVGVLVKNWSRRNEVLPSPEIQLAIDKLMIGREGEAIKRRARDLAAAVRSSTAIGGTSRADLDAFVARATR